MARAFVLAVTLFVLAVAMGRFVLTGGWGWAAFAVAVPVLWALLASRLGALPAVVVVVMFVALALLVRVAVRGVGPALALLLLVPVVALAAKIAYNVVQALRKGPEALGITVEEGEKEREEAGP